MNAQLTRADCAYAVSGHAYRSPAEILRAAATFGENADRDFYGDGRSLAKFETDVATLLGMEAAVFMPSGTMAQQIALRIVADRRGIRSFAGHPTNHVVLSERNGFARLHDLTFVPVGSALASLAPSDVAAIREPVSTLLLELPQRELGGELPTWEELVAIVDEARARGWHVHLDGARLWECGPYYARPYAEIAALFDSVYVSFYKGIGAVAGAMLLGPRAFVEEAKVWQRRHGGSLYSLFPYAFIAEAAFHERIPRFGQYHAAALAVADALAPFPAVTIRPAPPVTNMMHAFIRGDRARLAANAQRVARELGVWTIGRLQNVETLPTLVPGVSMWEISCGDATLALGDDRLRAALAGLFSD